MVVIPKDISGFSSSGNGVSCYYVPLTDGVGLKVFSSKGDAERCYALHKLLFDHPKTKRKVPRIESKVVKVSVGRWAYAVETVGVYDTNTLVQKKLLKIENTSKICDLAEELSAFAYSNSIKVKNIKRYFESEEGFVDQVDRVFSDSHLGNVGLRKGRLVWIDFSRKWRID